MAADTTTATVVSVGAVGSATALPAVNTIATCWNPAGAVSVSPTAGKTIIACYVIYKCLIIMFFFKELF